jgi:hypothetical protein
MSWYGTRNEGVRRLFGAFGIYRFGAWSGRNRSFRADIARLLRTAGLRNLEAEPAD